MMDRVSYGPVMGQARRSRKLAAGFVAASLLAVAALAVTGRISFVHQLQQNGVQREELASVQQTFDELANFNWGKKNPETGMDRVECTDTVAQDPRFHGKVGQKFTVECPAHCAHYGSTVHGCGKPNQWFMDDSSICRAAIAMRKLGHQNSGIVTFEIKEPVRHYDGCSYMPQKPGTPYGEDKKVHAVTSMPYTWHQWDKATRPDKVKKYGVEGAKLRYRTYKAPHYTYGLRAFMITDGEANVNLLNAGGESNGHAVVSAAKASSLFAQVSGIKTVGDKGKSAGSEQPSADKKISQPLSAASKGPGLTVEAWVKDVQPRARAGYVSAGVSLSADRDKAESGFMLGSIDNKFSFGLATKKVAKLSFAQAPEWMTKNLRDTWTHLAGTYDGKSMKLYVNGKFVACDETQVGEISYAASGRFTMASLFNSYDGHSNLFTGEVDEVRVWDTALSEQDINQYMKKTINEPLPPQLRVYYRFDGQDPKAKKVCAETAGYDATITGGIQLGDSGAPVEMLEEALACKVDLSNPSEAAQ